MYNTHPHISTQEVSISAKNGNERITLRNKRWAVTRANRRNRHHPYNSAALWRHTAQPLMDDNRMQTDPWHRRPPVRRGRLVKERVTEQLTMQHVNKRLTVWQCLRGSQAIFYAAAESAGRGLTSRRAGLTSAPDGMCVCVRDVWMHGLLSQQ